MTPAEALYNYTMMVLITAEQLCFYHNRDHSTDEDIERAGEMVARWNAERIKLGLEPWI